VQLVKPDMSWRLCRAQIVPRDTRRVKREKRLEGNYRRDGGDGGSADYCVADC
jgi:hypothetical protein